MKLISKNACKTLLLVSGGSNISIGSNSLYLKDEHTQEKENDVLSPWWI
jgi:hypothetical protein